MVDTTILPAVQVKKRVNLNLSLTLTSLANPFRIPGLLSFTHLNLEIECFLFSAKVA